MDRGAELDRAGGDEPLPLPSAGPARRVSLTRQPVMAPLLPPSLNPALQLLLTDDQSAAVTASLDPLTGRPRQLWAWFEPLFLTHEKRMLS